MLNRMIEAQNKLAPELTMMMEERFNVLKTIWYKGPIGRRTLSEVTNFSERETRAMLEQFRNQQLITISNKGAMITEIGIEVLDALEKMIEKLSNRLLKAKQLADVLQIAQVKIVSGNSDQEPIAKELIGKETALLLMQKINEINTIAVTGGSTVATIPIYMPKQKEHSDKLFIAARGGFGSDAELQANVIAANFANAYNCEYVPVHYPDLLSLEAQKIFYKEKQAIQMLWLYENIDCVIHGIGEAVWMAEQRGTSPHYQRKLVHEKAKGEAFGYYFGQSGKVVHQTRTIGIQIEQLKRVPHLIAVAGGERKAQAILSYMATAPSQTILITDDGAANEILAFLKDEI